MSLAVGLHAFIVDPTAGAAALVRPAQMYAQGFRHVVLHALAHEHDTEHYDELQTYADAARAAGLKAHVWQTLHPGFRSAACASKMVSQFPASQPLRWWDGAVPNLETALATPEGDAYCSMLTAGLHADVGLAVTTEPTFPQTAGLKLLEQRGAVVMPQAYELENGHTPVSVRSFVVDRPPLYVGWTYWCDFLRLPGRPARRTLVELHEGGTYYVLKDGRNRWRLDELSRRVTNRLSGKWVGMLRGTWRLPLVAPTVRTTPMGDGRWLTAAELLADLRAARFVDGALADRGGVYLWETTQDPADWRVEDVWIEVA